MLQMPRELSSATTVVMTPALRQKWGRAFRFMKVVVLEQAEIDEMLRRAADLAVSKLRDDIERTRTPELMDATQLSVYLNCHRSTINRHVKRGMPEEMCGDVPRYRKTSIDLWLQGRWYSE